MKRNTIFNNNNNKKNIHTTNNPNTCVYVFPILNSEQCLFIMRRFPRRTSIITFPWWCFFFFSLQITTRTSNHRLVTPHTLLPLPIFLSLHPFFPHTPLLSVFSSPTFIAHTSIPRSIPFPHHQHNPPLAHLQHFSLQSDVPPTHIPWPSAPLLPLTPSVCERYAVNKRNVTEHPQQHTHTQNGSKCRLGYFLYWSGLSLFFPNHCVLPFSSRQKKTKQKKPSQDWAIPNSVRLRCWHFIVYIFSSFNESFFIPWLCCVRGDLGWWQKKGAKKKAVVLLSSSSSLERQPNSASPIFKDSDSFIKSQLVHLHNNRPDLFQHVLTRLSSQYLTDACLMGKKWSKAYSIVLFCATYIHTHAIKHSFQLN